jgi:hypothetical protein
LAQSDELDHQAMLSIAGGARTGVQPLAAGATTSNAGRIVDYPPGFRRQGPVQAQARRPPE